jgi:serine/threonine protein kinase
MFSNYNSGLVSHSDGMFTRYSASTDRTSGDLQSDLIDFLSIVQKCNVDYLPITWQPALGNIGHGGSGMISQSTFSTDMPLAFKRFHVLEPDESDSVFDYLPLISEVMILSQLPIRNHPNIINLQGICWEVKPRTRKAIPVLVFEKAAWDLQQFMNVYEGRNMSIDGRLKLCADIGSAIMALHDYGLFIKADFHIQKANIETDVIHGDIKPQNVLVFKDTAGKTTVKVTDFGYSTFTAPETSSVGRTGSVFLPKSRPWNAPEHHFGDFTALEAKKADVYSFGMLCFWILFGNICMPQNMEYTFDTSTGPSTSLEQIKYDDKMEYVANQLMESVSVGAGLNAKHKSRLQIFFSLTVPLNPEKRTTDIAKLLGLLGQEQRFHLKYYVNTVAKMFRTEPQPFSEGLGIMVTNTELSRHAHFRVSIKSIYVLYNIADNRLDC